MMTMPVRNDRVQRNTGTQLRRPAFTLVEMLIAMTVTLLLMAALGRGFNFIGETIRDSRTQVEVTSQLRSVTSRLQTELAACTVPLQPCLSGQSPTGYFLYHEGPLTDATSSLFLAQTDDSGAVVTPYSRYGDFDDYLAFTAVAPDNHWFSGIIPRFILDQKTAAQNGVAYNPSNFSGSPVDPVVIRSRYAEIVYFASPEYAADGTMIDIDGAGLPTNIRLHRRVLLIRPDLNVGGLIPSRTVDGTAYLAAPLQWDTGMAAAHQQCDLSLRRVYVDGGATTNVAANSLTDLANPSNRFAHVRAPADAIGYGGTPESSMPMLALTPPVPLIQSAIASEMAPPSVTTGSVGTPIRHSGFLRREFVLGNLDVGAARLGEDVVATGVLGFDIKIYDRKAPIITTNAGQTVRSSDPGFREALRNYTVTPLRGDYVDLMYPVLAGGPTRGWQPRLIHSLSASPDAALPAASLDLLQTEFSGVAQFTNDPRTAYQESLYRSGKIIVDGSNAISLFQPVFDTYTTAFERDGFFQGHLSSYGGDGKGTKWLTVDPTADDDPIDRGADGINYSSTAILGADNFFERETCPPFLQRPESIQISIRLEHSGNRQVHQMSVVHRDNR